MLLSNLLVLVLQIFSSTCDTEWNQSFFVEADSSFPDATPLASLDPEGPVMEAE